MVLAGLLHRREFFVEGEGGDDVSRSAVVVRDDAQGASDDDAEDDRKGKEAWLVHAASEQVEIIKIAVVQYFLNCAAMSMRSMWPRKIALQQ